ncbi:MAG TPA: hypothetical protein VG944_24420 [Fimbriimonas sp.]|nr:hypothetical protein [Fimbriimonas sp.]
MASTVQKAFRIPVDVAKTLESKGNSTEYLVNALREKFERDEEERFRLSARRISQGAREQRDVEFAVAAQSEIVDEG